MIRRSLLSICIAALFLPLVCRRKASAPPLPSGTRVTTEVESEEMAPPDPQDVATSKRHVTRQAVVTSKYPTLDGSTVLKYTNSLVAISVGIEDVIDYFEKHFAVHPNLQSEKRLAEKLRGEAGTRPEYRYEDFSRDERERLHYCLAALLEEGKFVLALSSSGETVSQISVCEYSWMRGPLDGDGGRIFFLKDGRAFFMICDWVS
jgi:hypothetical protein